MASPKEGARLRRDISDLIKQVHCLQNQNLRDVTLPREVYLKSSEFTRTETIKHCHYYPTLDKMEGGGVYGLLEKAAGEASVVEGYGLLQKWKDAVNSLLRYALNLLLAPNRPELKTVKLYTSYFVYQISDKLKGMEKVLFVLGYHPKQQTSSESSLGSSQELVYKGEVDRDHVAEVATDLVILGSDLEHLQEKVREDNCHSTSRWFMDVLRAWKNDFRNVMIRSAHLGPSRDEEFCNLEANQRYYSGGLDGGQKLGHGNLHMHGGYAAGGGNLVVGIGAGLRVDHTSHVNHWNDSAEIMVRPHQEGMYQRPVVGGDVNNGGFGYGHQLSHGIQEDRPVHVPPTARNQRESGSSYGREERFSTDASADEDSILIIDQNIPRPNIEDLPDPVSFESRGDEHGGMDGAYNSDLSLIINPRSDNLQDSMIGPEYYAHMPPDQSLMSPGMWTGRGGNYDEVVHEEMQAPVSEVGPSLQDSPSQQRQHSPFHLDEYDIIGMDDILRASENLSQYSKKVTSQPSGVSAVTDNNKIQPGSSKNSSSKSNHISRTKLTRGSSLQETEGENGFTVVDLDSGKDDKTRRNDYVTDKSPPKEVVKSISEKGTLISSMWTCDFCTYINSADTSECGICGIDKNKPK